MTSARTMTPVEANSVIKACGINASHDFHRLDSGQVASLIHFADFWKYREPRYANGSRARYFFQRLVRLAGKAR